jgi:acyl transferase domain-containing protein/NADP-dependent 3-hydroxy acid dehydrogenase YdfG/acyl carrier protein
MKPSPNPQRANHEGQDIAVIGMACRFPDAGDYRAFWRNLRDGRASVRELGTERWDSEQFYSPDPDAPNRGVSKWAGLIDDADKFDAGLFRISPREAELMDPQQRILLELTWSCLEDAGYAPAKLRGSGTGVYIGVCNFDYKEALAASLASIEAHLSTGTYATLIPNRISYEFDFKGPSLPIDTACSSSLVALHEAIHAIRRGECTQAIAGGVSILCSPTYFVAFSKAGMLSPRGVCRTFDHGADGYVRGEGAGVVLLKPLDRAIADRDRVWGIIKGTAVNHGGRTPSVTSPSAFAQARVIADAIRRSGVAVDRIGYVEAHGTGTPKGDPIEVHGLQRAFQTVADQSGTALPRRSCGLGSVKTNIGHLEAAAGIAGLIKVLLAMAHRTLPGLLHLERLNPRIRLDGSPFYLVERPEPWRAPDDGVRRAGISSFGFGGVNAHVVVEEPPPLEARLERAPAAQVIVLSARTPDRLRAYAADLLAERASWDSGGASIADIAFTLQRREAMEERVAFVVESSARLAAALAELARGDAARVVYGNTTQGAARIAPFLPDGDRRAVFEAWLAGRDLDQLMALWVAGLPVDWAALHDAATRPRLIALPSYPFERRRYWLPASAAPAPVTSGLWEVAASWTARALPGTGRSPASDAGVLWLTLLDATGDAYLADRAGARMARLPVPVEPDPDRGWIDACWAAMDVIQGAMTRHAPARMVLLSNTAPEFAAMMFALLQSVQKELEVPARWYAWEPGAREPTALLRAVLDDAATGDAVTGATRLVIADGAVRCEDRRWSFRPLAPRTGPASWARGGVFWIPGGGGGIGRKVAAHLAQRYGATVILSGRSDAQAPAEPPRSAEQVGSILYRTADCTRRRELEQLLAWILDHHGRLTGVIHAAGALRDRGLFAKQREDVDAVMRPKVEGALLVDEVTRGCALECFCVFSSLTGLWGNAGQTDYAAANAFLGGFARRRRAQVARGERSGSSIVIHWPYWRAGGMQLPPHLVERLEEAFGMRPLEDADGLAAFDHALATRCDELAVTSGTLAVIERALAAIAPRVPPRTVLSKVVAAAPSVPSPPAAPAAPAASGSPGAAPPPRDPLEVAAWLTAALSELTGNPPDELPRDSHFAEYGVDSLLLLRLMRRVNDAFGLALEILDLHNHPSIAELAAVIAGGSAAPEPAAPAGDPEPRKVPVSSAVAAPAAVPGFAIVGLDVRVPGAAGLAELWDLVSAGERHAGCYPEHRWRLLPPALVGDLSRDACPGWFLDDALRFDHRLFGVSPREAMVMDPQQRQVLHSVWRAIEHAGYARAEFARRPTAVLLSIDTVDYEQLVHHDATIDEFTGTGVSRYIAANRISHTFNLRGVSEPVDTACSSFFVALSRAIDAMERGGAEQAIVAAVQLNLLPSRFRVLRERSLLSRGPVTRPFDRDGDGFVRSEGAGAVVIKPLARAIEDRDHIHGVIRGCAVWHAGRAVGVTAPSSAAHQQAIKQALVAAGVTADSLGYIEAHGTGMPLGDASELDAIDQVFRDLGRDRSQPCVLGAAKAALGHLEAASGVAALAKVVLALDRGRVPGLVHLRTPNPRFSPESGLRLSASEQPIAAPRDGGPPRAGVLSYGLGGVSAFVVVERPPAVAPAVAPAVETGPPRPELFVLSAQTPAVLRRYAAAIAGFLSAAVAAGRPVELRALVETYRSRRDPMASRVAVIAASVDELRAKLAAFGAGELAEATWVSPAERPAPASSDELARWLAAGDLGGLAAAYVAGADIAWPAATTPRQPFPEYPFHTDREFWISPRPAAREPA